MSYLMKYVYCNIINFAVNKDKRVTIGNRKQQQKR